MLSLTTKMEGSKSHLRLVSLMISFMCIRCLVDPFSNVRGAPGVDRGDQQQEDSVTAPNDEPSRGLGEEILAEAENLVSRRSVKIREAQAKLKALCTQQHLAAQETVQQAREVFSKEVARLEEANRQFGGSPGWSFARLRKLQHLLQDPEFVQDHFAVHMIWTLLDLIEVAELADKKIASRSSERTFGVPIAHNTTVLLLRLVCERITGNPNCEYPLPGFPPGEPKRRPLRLPWLPGSENFGESEEFRSIRMKKSLLSTLQRVEQAAKASPSSALPDDLGNNIKDDAAEDDKSPFLGRLAKEQLRHIFEMSSTPDVPQVTRIAAGEKLEDVREYWGTVNVPLKTMYLCVFLYASRTWMLLLEAVMNHAGAPESRRGNEDHVARRGRKPENLREALNLFTSYEDGAAGTRSEWTSWTRARRQFLDDVMKPGANYPHWINRTGDAVLYRDRMHPRYNTRKQWSKDGGFHWFLETTFEITRSPNPALVLYPYWDPRAVDYWNTSSLEWSAPRYPFASILHGFLLVGDFQYKGHEYFKLCLLEVKGNVRDKDGELLWLPAVHRPIHWNPLDSPQFVAYAVQNVVLKDEILFRQTPLSFVSNVLRKQQGCTQHEVTREELQTVLENYNHPSSVRTTLFGGFVSRLFSTMCCSRGKTFVAASSSSSLPDPNRRKEELTPENQCLSRASVREMLRNSIDIWPGDVFETRIKRQGEGATVPKADESAAWGIVKDLQLRRDRQDGNKFKVVLRSVEMTGLFPEDLDRRQVEGLQTGAGIVERNLEEAIGWPFLRFEV